MAVTFDLVRVHVLRDRDEVGGLRGLTTGPRDTALAIHDRVGGDLAQRPERQQRSGRIAPRRGDKRGGADLIAMRLGEPVDGAGQQFRRLVWLVVRLVALPV